MLCGFGDCGTSVHRFCAYQSEQYEKKFENAVIALQPWHPVRDRLPASAVEPLLLAEMDRDAWKSWAEQRLKETQYLMDRAETDPRLNGVRVELSEVANALVTFHGYSAQGNAERMLKTLEQIQVHSQKARGLACTEDAQPGE